MPKRSIFIAATGQNVGKTTVCLGLLAGLRKRYRSVGFIKPIGQEHVQVEEGSNVDKDAVLFKEYFGLSSSYEAMSPVICSRGFTRNFLDHKIDEQRLLSHILESYQKIRQSHEYVLVEGTGHVGVGSLINLNNARIAQELNQEIVIISSGGLGSSFDELSLNLAMCHLYGVKVRGVILNRVHHEKRQMILDYFPKALKRWNIPLIGCIPYNDFLGTPTMNDFELLFKAPLLSGEAYRYRHFQNTRLVAGSLATYLGELKSNQLIITPASREDIIQATLDMHTCNKNQEGENFECGMILTSQQPPSSSILEKIKNSNIPVLYAPVCSYDAMKMITHFTAKTRKEDTPKIEQAIKLVEEYVNFELLCDPAP